MPQAIVRKTDLPPVGKDGFYTIRVRVVSDDKNSASYWTPIYHMSIPLVGDKKVADAVQVSVYQNRIGQSEPKNFNIYVSWHDPNELGFYDVYTQWHTVNGWTDWMYLDTQTQRNFAFNPPLYLTTPGDPNTYFDMYNVAITRSNYHHEFNPDLALFNTNTAPNGGLALV